MYVTIRKVKLFQEKNNYLHLDPFATLAVFYAIFEAIPFKIEMLVFPIQKFLHPFTLLKVKKLSCIL